MKGPFDTLNERMMNGKMMDERPACRALSRETLPLRMQSHVVSMHAMPC